MTFFHLLSFVSLLQIVSGHRRHTLALWWSLQQMLSLSRATAFIVSIEARHLLPLTLVSSMKASKQEHLDQRV